MSATPVTRICSAPPDRVWQVLADGWTYPAWVVGASHMRAVTADWPQVGATLHHSVGTWPAVVQDETTVLQADPGRRLVLEAKGRPLGRARVEITLTPQAQGTLISMSEDVSSGPALAIPSRARQLAITARNTEALSRLAMLAEQRTDPHGN